MGAFQESTRYTNVVLLKTSLLMILLLTAFVTSGTVFAQESDADQYEGENVLEEIIVTADKRGATSAQDLAVAITAFDGNKIDRLNATDFDEFIVFVPSTNFIDNGGPGRGQEVASIRGLQPVSDSTESTVATYLDGGPRSGGNYRLFDIGEISVLRGPQGTLWGAQALGGVISYRSNRPDTTAFSGKALGDFYSSDGDGGLSYRTHAMVNIPLIEDKLAFRFAGQYIDESGYVDNIVTGDNNVNEVTEKAYRVSMLYQPTERISFTAIYHHSDLDADAPSFFSADLPDYQSEDESNNSPATEKYGLLNLILEIEMDWANFSYTGSFFNLDRKSSTWAAAFLGDDPGNSNLTETQDSNTHELRLASTDNDSKWGWIAGLYYDDLDGYRLDDYVPDYSDGEQIFTYGGPTDVTEKALFGEVTYDFNETYQLLLGARFYDWKVKAVPVFTFFGSDYSNPPGTADDNGSLFKVQFNARPNDNTLVYGLVSEGFRIGGFNAGVNEAVGFPPEYSQYNPDELTNYELGYKSIWLEGRMLFNAAAYYMKWNNVQSVVTNEDGNFFITANGPDLKAHGFELEWVIQDIFVENLYAAATYSYTKNEFQGDAVIFPGTPTNIHEGDELRRTPRNSWSLDMGYDFQIGSGTDAYIRANYWHKDATTTSGYNREDGDIDVPAQNVINASAGIVLDSWGFKLYMNNISNSRPFLQIFPNSIDNTLPSIASSVRPRTIGLEVTYLFGN